MKPSATVLELNAGSNTPITKPDRTLRSRTPGYSELSSQSSHTEHFLLQLKYCLMRTHLAISTQEYEALQMLTPDALIEKTKAMLNDYKAATDYSPTEATKQAVENGDSSRVLTQDEVVQPNPITVTPALTLNLIP